MAGGEEDLAVTIANADVTVDGAQATAGADVANAVLTMVPLTVAFETGDVTGPPFGRANGHLDYIKATFMVDIVIQAIHAGIYQADHVLGAGGLGQPLILGPVEFPHEFHFVPSCWNLPTPHGVGNTTRTTTDA